jgi:hypothetical protein
MPSTLLGRLAGILRRRVERSRLPPRLNTKSGVGLGSLPSR